jgi:hypothetical protein
MKYLLEIYVKSCNLVALLYTYINTILYGYNDDIF